MKKRCEKAIAVLAVVIMMAVAGCGGGGGGVAPQTLSGAVQTPGGTTSARTADRSAAALQNVTSAVTVNAYSVSSAGALTLLASADSDASGNFSITLPSGVRYDGTLIMLSTTFGAVALRTLVTAASSVAISPVTEAAVQVLEDGLNQSGRNYSDLTLTEISTIKQNVDTALADEDFSSAGSVSDAVAIATNTASRDEDVQAAIDSALPESATTTVTLAVVTTTDWSSGALAAVQLDGNPSASTTANTSITTIHSDATIAADENYVYVINRMGQDNIQVLDPADGLSLVTQYSTGNGSNPQDIEIISETKAYVSRYGTDTILIVNPSTGAEAGTISLADFADADGLPEMSEMVTVGNKVFVIVQNLVSWAPAGTSRLAVIDTTTDTLIDTSATATGTQGVTLVGQNPQYMVYNEAADKIFVSCSGNYFDAEVAGGIDVVDPDTYIATQLATKTALGGSPGDLVVVSSTKGYVVVTDASYVNTIVPFNPGTGAVSSSIYTPGGYSVGSLAVDPYGYLMVPDMSYTAPGIVFIDTLTDTTAAGPISTGLPPYAIAFISYQTSE